MVVNRSVGLVLVTEVSSLGVVAVLQRRGWFNTEKMCPELWPGGCQVTAHGNLEEGEGFAGALIREVNEELGRSMMTLVSVALGAGRLIQVNHIQNDEMEVMTYAVGIDARKLGLIRLGPDSGGLVLVTREQAEVIANLYDFSRNEGVVDTRNIAMFPSERAAVVSALERLALRGSETAR